MDIEGILILESRGCTHLARKGDHLDDVGGVKLADFLMGVAIKRSGQVVKESVLADSSSARSEVAVDTWAMTNG